jgi:hypothetical protein
MEEHWIQSAFEVVLRDVLERKRIGAHTRERNIAFNEIHKVSLSMLNIRGLMPWLLHSLGCQKGGLLQVVGDHCLQCVSGGSNTHEDDVS